MKKVLIVLLAVSLFVIVLLISTSKESEDSIVTKIIPNVVKNKLIKKDISEIKTFESEAEFKKYLAQAPEDYNYYNDSDDFLMEEQMVDSLSYASPGLNSYSDSGNTKAKSFGGFSKSSTTRSSKTNVQVIGIDEPDIVKTDGKNIFLAHDFPYFLQEPVLSFNEVEGDLVPDKKITPSIQNKKGIHTIQAIPPGDMKIINDLDVYGELLLENKNLVVLGDKNIYGYDISNNEKKWSISINEDVQIETARLSDGKLYLLTKTRIKRSAPCPIRPLKIDGTDVLIPCNSINHPIKPVPANITYSLMKINIKTGQLDDKISFVGSQGNVVTYMSLKNFYVSYPNRVSEVNLMLDLILSDSNLFPIELNEKVKKLASYDISDKSKKRELDILLETFTESLEDDKKLELESNAENAAKRYFEKNIRKVENSSIVKIPLKKLKVDNVGIIPGHLLNQFSMDEYKNNLRIATTVNSIEDFAKSVNDVYILDNKMNIVGSALDMGKDEKIYSVRFMGDKGYVVTFRETDPFYILDLKTPTSPKITGELKIPGYSSYLHSLGDDLILGIGKEDGKVKLSTFDVSDVSNPKETSKYMLDEYYSEAVDNHHAFLLDDKHKVFFLPGSKGGYVFTFKNSNLEMKKAISADGVRRALYINDYLYVISQNNIAVINENDWQKVQDFSIYNTK